MSARRYWTVSEETVLRALYPHVRTATLAGALARPVGPIYQRAQKLGLAKSEEYLASPASGRTTGRQGIGTRFGKGHVPANKGMRRPGWGPGRMKATQFKKGQKGSRWMPLGSERLIDGYRYTKVADVPNVPYTVNWKPTHVLGWEAAHGPVPDGHALVFRNRDRADVRLENLELITRRELMLRNTIHNLPAPLPQTIQLLGALKRKINRRIRDEEQDRGSTQSPVRGAGGTGGPGEAAGHRACEGDRGRRPGDRRLGEGGSRVPRRNAENGHRLHSAGRSAVDAAAARGQLRSRVAPRCTLCSAALTYKGRGRPPERCRPGCAA